MNGDAYFTKTDMGRRRRNFRSTSCESMGSGHGGNSIGLFHIQGKTW